MVIQLVFSKRLGELLEFKRVIKDFFNSSSLLKQANHMVIALVPETDHSSSVGDYRPIVCCNVFYK